MRIATEIIKIAKKKGIMIATAESCTAGMVATALTDIPGSSNVIDRGYVTYSDDAKTEMLGVLSTTVASHGAVSEQVAAEMAIGALTQAPVHLTVSVTGIAGPGGSQFKPEGLVCFGLANAQHVKTKLINFGAIGRKQVRLEARNYALSMIYKFLTEVQ